MYTIISGTNREGSNTLKVARLYKTFFEQENIKANLYSLEDLKSVKRDDDFEKVEKEWLIPSTKFVFIMPEYNGSFPGILKVMIDISDIKQCWNYEKVMLVGVANGRAGNLRGLDTMTNMCHYMKMNVYFDKLPISSISNELRDGSFHNPFTIEAIQRQVKGYIEF